ncbi:MAG: hypothetical protein NC411_05665 [Bacteroides sp.]|nr:hypothetical protein [Bacteroides sp.]
MKDILTQINRNDGMTVPDGYFESFAEKMAASLPTQEWEKKTPKVMPRSFWQRVRPYVYMAAMFMGVWCMMKMFDLMRHDSYGLSFENNPIMTAAINNEYFINDYFIDECDVDDYQMMDALYETGFEPASYSLDSDDAIMPEFTDSTLETPDEPQFPLSEI